MLTDMFAHRYQAQVLRQNFESQDARLLTQMFRILEEQVQPYWIDGSASEKGKTFWKHLNSQISMELGLTTLSPDYGGGGAVPSVYICKNWMLANPGVFEKADAFIKERLSLVEVGFRAREKMIVKQNSATTEFLQSPAMGLERLATRLRVPGNSEDAMKARYARENSEFQAAVDELNERFKRASYPLHYHNGFIQFSDDEITSQTIEEPFWALLTDEKWQNVDTDMKEALDRRDTDGRDPAFYAARALESAIKIVSSEKGWTRGNESGAHNFIDNLQSKKNGSLIAAWEAETLESFFTHVRNPLGHGPGMEAMPGLTKPQTCWAISYCMAWIKSLIDRL